MLPKKWLCLCLPVAACCLALSAPVRADLTPTSASLDESPSVQVSAPEASAAPEVKTAFSYEALAYAFTRPAQPIPFHFERLFAEHWSVQGGLYLYLASGNGQGQSLTSTAGAELGLRYWLQDAADLGGPFLELSAVKFANLTTFGDAGQSLFTQELRGALAFGWQAMSSAPVALLDCRVFVTPKLELLYAETTGFNARFTTDLGVAW